MSVVDRNIAPEIKMAEVNVAMPETKTLHLDNGIPVTMINSGCQDVYRLTLMWDGGNVEASSPSVSNLVVQMLREGTTTLNGEEISNILENNGAWVKGMTQSHNTAVVLHALNHTADEVYATLCDMITAPSFPADALDAIRENLAGNLETNLKRVDYLSQIAIRNMMFGAGHRMSRTETPDDIRAISADELAQYHNVYMRPKDVHIYLAGKIDDTLIDCLNSHFGRKLDVKGGADTKLILEPALRRPEDERTEIINTPGAAQSSVRMAIPVIARNHPDYIPLRIATVALGGYFGSRLMSSIREDKGLTYGINAGLYGYREGSMVMIGAQTSNETVGALIEETGKEITRLKTGDMSTDELIRLQRFMYTQLLSQLDTPFAIMDYYENLRINDIKGDYFRQQCEAISRITASTVSEMAEKYFDLEAMRIAVAGNSDIINI